MRARWAAAWFNLRSVRNAEAALPFPEQPAVRTAFALPITSANNCDENSNSPDPSAAAQIEETQRLAFMPV